MTGTSHSHRIFFSRPTPESIEITFSGDWKNAGSLPAVDDIIDDMRSDLNLRRVQFNTSELLNWDSKVLTAVRKIYDFCETKNIEFDAAGLPSGVARLLDLIKNNRTVERGDGGIRPDILDIIGDTSLKVFHSFGEFQQFIGEMTLSFFRFITGKARFRGSDFLHLLQDAGANALPIITLVSFLIGVILAFIGSVQLEMFGAQIYVANLVAIAMAREMGPMMTAIVVAGRSGAGYAAELGTMMVNEEIDAYKTLGFSPMDFLVLPRVLALTLMMPLLVLYSDFMGILGGAAVGVGMLDLSFTQYFEQTRVGLAPMGFVLGLIKATIYGSLVALAGCMRGIQCGRSASAVGQATTSAVVTAIVLILVASGITTVIFNVLGI